MPNFWDYEPEDIYKERQRRGPTPPPAPAYAPPEPQPPQPQQASEQGWVAKLWEQAQQLMAPSQQSPLLGSIAGTIGMGIDVLRGETTLPQLAGQYRQQLEQARQEPRMMPLPLSPYVPPEALPPQLRPQMRMPAPIQAWAEMAAANVPAQKAMQTAQFVSDPVRRMAESGVGRTLGMLTGEVPILPELGKQAMRAPLAPLLGGLAQLVDPIMLLQDPKTLPEQVKQQWEQDIEQLSAAPWLVRLLPMAIDVGISMLVGKGGAPKPIMVAQRASYITYAATAPPDDLAAMAALYAGGRMVGEALTGLRVRKLMLRAGGDPRDMAFEAVDSVAEEAAAKWSQQYPEEALTPDQLRRVADAAIYGRQPPPDMPSGVNLRWMEIGNDLVDRYAQAQKASLELLYEMDKKMAWLTRLVSGWKDKTKNITIETPEGLTPGLATEVAEGLGRTRQITSDVQDLAIYNQEQTGLSGPLEKIAQRMRDIGHGFLGDLARGEVGAVTLEPEAPAEPAEPAMAEFSAGDQVEAQGHMWRVQRIAGTPGDRRLVVKRPGRRYSEVLHPDTEDVRKVAAAPPEPEAPPAARVPPELARAGRTTTDELEWVKNNLREGGIELGARGETSPMMLPDGTPFKPSAPGGLPVHWQAAIDAGYVTREELELTEASNEAVVNGLLKKGWLRWKAKGLWEIWDTSDDKLRIVESGLAQDARAAKPGASIYIDVASEKTVYETSFDALERAGGNLREALQGAKRTPYDPAEPMEFEMPAEVAPAVPVTPETEVPAEIPPTLSALLDKAEETGKRSWRRTGESVEFEAYRLLRQMAKRGEATQEGQEVSYESDRGTLTIIGSYTNDVPSATVTFTPRAELVPEALELRPQELRPTARVEQPTFLTAEEARPMFGAEGLPRRVPEGAPEAMRPMEVPPEEAARREREVAEAAGQRRLEERGPLGGTPLAELEWVKSNLRTGGIKLGPRGDVGRMMLPDGTPLHPTTPRGIANHWEAAIDAGYLGKEHLEKLGHLPSAIVNGLLRKGWLRWKGEGLWAVWDTSSQKLRIMEPILLRSARHAKPDSPIYIDAVGEKTVYKLTFGDLEQAGGNLQDALQRAERSTYEPTQALELARPVTPTPEAPGLAPPLAPPEELPEVPIETEPPFASSIRAALQYAREHDLRPVAIHSQTGERAELTGRLAPDTGDIETLARGDWTHEAVFEIRDAKTGEVLFHRPTAEVPPGLIVEGRPPVALEEAPAPEVRPTEEPPEPPEAPAVAEVPQAIAPELLPAPSERPSKTTVARGADPTDEYEMRFRLVELDDLIASQTETLADNPDYPAKMQPRRRDRKAARLQVQDIAQNPSYGELLEDTHTLSRGIPIIGPDMIVEGGNGRVAGLRKMREEFPANFKEYQAELRRRLADYEIDPTEADRLSAPVLVRERTTPLPDMPAREEFARKANRRDTLGMSPFETAQQDAELLTDEMVSGLTVGESDTIDGALKRADNRPFVRRFLQLLPPNEQATLVDADGSLSRLGLGRIKSALLAKTYPGEAGKRLVSRFTESMEPGIKRIETGLFASLPDMARAESLMRRGTKDPKLSIGDDLSQVVDMLARLRNEKMRLSDYLAQAPMFRPTLSKFQKRLLEYVDEISNSGARVRDFLRLYAQGVQNSPTVDQLAMLGVTAPTKGDLLEQVAERLEAEGRARAPSLFEAAEAAQAEVAAPAREAPAGVLEQLLEEEAPAVAPEALGVRIRRTPMERVRVSDEIASLRAGISRATEPIDRAFLQKRLDVTLAAQRRGRTEFSRPVSRRPERGYERLAVEGVQYDVPQAMRSEDALEAIKRGQVLGAAEPEAAPPVEEAVPEAPSPVTQAVAQLQQAVQQLAGALTPELAPPTPPTETAPPPAAVPAPLPAEAIPTPPAPPPIGGQPPLIPPEEPPGVGVQRRLPEEPPDESQWDLIKRSRQEAEDKPPFRDRIRALLAKANMTWMDRFAPIKELKGGMEVYNDFALIGGARKRAQSLLEQHVFPNLRRVEEHWDEFWDYMVARRMPDLQAIAEETGVEAKLPAGVTDPGAAIAAMESKLGSEVMATFSEVAEEFWSGNQRLVLQEAVRFGILSQSMADAIWLRHPHYVPYYRQDFDAIQDLASETIGRGGARSPRAFSKRMKAEGSYRRLKDPFQSYMESFMDLQIRGARNIATQRLMDTLSANDPAFVQEGDRTRTGWGAVQFLRNGERVTVTLPQPYDQIVQSLDGYTMGVIGELFRRLTRPLVLGAVVFNPTFPVRNVIKDGARAYLTEGVVPIANDWSAGMVAAFTHSERWHRAAEAYVLGGGFAEIAGRPGPLRRLGPMPGIPGKRVGGIALTARRLSDVPWLISRLNEAVEEGTKIGAFEKLTKSGVMGTEGAARAANSTTNFWMGGFATRVLTNLTPFLNARVGGIRTVIEAAKRNPRKSLLRLLPLLIPSLALYLWNKRHASAALIPDYEYRNNYVLIVGEGTEEPDPRYPEKIPQVYPIYLKIPKSEVVTFLSAPVEALLRMASAEDDGTPAEIAMRAAFEGLVDMSPVNVPALLPPVTGTAAQIAMNRDIFRRRNIVPQGEEGRPPEAQFGPETSKVAIALGRQFGISPRYIDFAIGDVTAGGGRALTWLSDLGLGAIGYEPAVPGVARRQELSAIEKLAQAPVVSALLGTRATAPYRRAYRTLDKAVEEAREALYRNPEVRRFGLGVNAPGSTITIDGVPQEVAPEQRAQIVELTTPRVERAWQELVSRDWYQDMDDTQRHQMLLKVRGKIQDNVRAHVLSNLTGEPTILYTQDEMGQLIDAYLLYEQYEAIPSYLGMTAEEEELVKQATSTISSWARAYPNMPTDMLRKIYAQQDPMGAYLHSIRGRAENPQRRVFWAANPLLSQYFGGVSVEEMQALAGFGRYAPYVPYSSASITELWAQQAMLAARPPTERWAEAAMSPIPAL